MLLHWAGTILLSLLTAESQGNRNIQTNGKEIFASPGSDIVISCSLPAGLSTSQAEVTWYKEKQDQSLRMIHQGSSHSVPDRKYSSPSNSPTDGSLAISNVQRNDSGVYYCVSPIYKSFVVHQKTRLIITNISRPAFSVLVPSFLTEDHLNHLVPVLCLIFDPNPAWETVVSWDIDGETSQVQKDIDTIDESGAFSIWSLKMVPAKTWTQRTAGNCSVQQYRTISAGVSTKTGNCNLVLYLGVPCIVSLLFFLAFILHFRKHLAREKAGQSANRVQMRELPQQTDYAELRYNR